MITRQCLDYIKDTVDIYDVVSPYVNLKKCGSNWRGLSPFTSEKTPSFFVMPTKKMFKCFSSGNAGDLFRFIQLKENVSFYEAVEMIADRFNIKLEFENIDKRHSKETSKKKTFFEINEVANNIFVKNFNLNDAFGKKVRSFWENVRNFSLLEAQKYSIGLCKNDEQQLLTELKKYFSLEELKKCGLFYFSSDNYSSFKLRFRYRLTIPIRDIQGRIVGFSARAVPELTSVLTDAKYINSPETEIFHKGNLLFGLYEARLHINECDHFWLVEGQLDVLRCWEKGLTTAVAPQGTAITDTQLQILKRYSSNLYCMLDGDKAGLRAAERLLHMAINAGLDVKYFLLPSGQDPDDFLKNISPETLQNFIKKSGLSIMEFAVKRYLPNSSSMSGRQKANALKNIYEIISNSDLSIIHESFLDEISQLCDLDRRAIGQDFETFLKKKRFSDPLSINNNSIDKIENQSNKINTVESQLIAICIEDPGLAKKISDIIEYDALTKSNLKESTILIKILNEAHEGLWEGINSLNNTKIFSEEERNTACSIFADISFPESIEFLANSCLKTIHIRFFKEKIAEIDKKISKISLDEKDMIRNLHKDRMYLRKRISLFPQI